MKKLVRMSVGEYKRWMKNPNRLKASTDKFHRNGFKRTLNVLEGDAKESSVKKWKQFKGRWEANANDGLTEREHIAIKNWGYKVVRK